MSYDYAANGWTQIADCYVKDIDGQCFVECPGETAGSRVIKPIGGYPEWYPEHLGYYTAEDIDAAWAAELKRREILPLLDPDKWSKTEDQGYSVHPDGYRLSQCADDVWYSIIMPYKSLRYSKTFKDAKRQCEIHARERKGLPPL
jgi:hypothetical protein